MSLNSSDENLCRICLKENVFFDWIEAIFEFSGPSYKECYYQYTRLQEQVEDPYTTMLCPDCANDLRNTYQLVEKALASDKKLKELKTYKNCDDPFKKEYEVEQVILPDTTELLLENSGEQILENSLTDVLVMNTDSDDAQISEEYELEKPLTEIEIIINAPEEDVQNADTVYPNEDLPSMSKSNCNQMKAKTKHKELPFMCMYCSKFFRAPCKLKNHERTHEKRERSEICPSCGLKFFDKVSLKYHIEIHTENRERRHKCEFCTKAFFNSGGLNIHRRIHLGQMVKCKLCSKEFYRQVDLDRHMKSHDIVPITADKEKQPIIQAKLYMDCKTCGKKVAWESWETHKAKHLNQPHLQCSICNKEYYTRKSLGRHLKQMHKISPAQYDKFIIQKFNKKFKPRLSSLMKQQNILFE